MPINIRKKLLFIHIPKTSGSYIHELLNMKGNNFLYSAYDDHVLGRTLQHYPYTLIRDVINTLNIMSSNIYIDIEKFLVFTIVRNPYYRFLSAYNQYPNRCNRKFAEMINNRSCKEFALYLKKRIESEGREFLKYGAYHQFQEMNEYIKGCDNIKIIKLDDEKFKDNIRRLCCDKEILYYDEKVNEGNNKRYDELLEDKELRDYIYYIYEDDFKMFGYERY